MNLHHQKRILNFIKENKAITSSELAKVLQISWNTADRYLMQLSIDGKVEQLKKTGVNIWILK